MLEKIMKRLKKHITRNALQLAVAISTVLLTGITPSYAKLVKVDKNTASVKLQDLQKLKTLVEQGQYYKQALIEERQAVDKILEAHEVERQLRQAQNTILTEQIQQLKKQIRKDNALHLVLFAEGFTCRENKLDYRAGIRLEWGIF